MYRDIGSKVNWLTKQQPRVRVGNMAVPPVRLEAPKGAKSVRWEYFGFEVDKDGKRVDEKYVHCRICNQKVGFSGNTTNLGTHLQKWHPAALQSGAPSTSKGPVQSTLQSYCSRPVTKLASNSKRAKEITLKIAEFVARDMRPIAIVEGAGFKNLIDALEPAYAVPSRKHVMMVLHGLYDDVKAHLLAELDSVEHVALTTDHWTSRAVDSYLGLTAHFVNQHWELVTRVLQTREVKERHTSANVADDLRSIVEEWRLSSKVVAIATDNAANMVAAIRLLPWPRIPCVAHTLQLAVKEGLKLPAAHDVVVRCRKVVGHFKHSCIATRALEAAQDRLGLPQKQLVQEVPTRWNSTYAMLDRIIEQQTAISAVLAESKRAVDRDMILTSGELAVMECMIGVLKPLAQATEMVGAQKTPTLSIVQPLLTALLKKHLKVSDVEPKVALDMKTIITSSIEGHFSDEEQHNFMLLVSCLDPRFSKLKFLPSRERADVYANLGRTANFYQGVVQDEEEQVAVPKKPKLDSLLEYHESGSDSNGSSPATASDRVEKEIVQYKAEAEIDSTADPLAWWKLNYHRYPLLSVLARKFLCITATSVPSERMFSEAGTIVDKKRCSLNPSNVDRLVFLHGNQSILGN